MAAVDDLYTIDYIPKCTTRVTTRIGEWALLAPETIAPAFGITAAMADRMAHWAVTNWKVDTEADLDRYTFGVAGCCWIVTL